MGERGYNEAGGTAMRAPISWQELLNGIACASKYGRQA
jgi:hypothetical protein